MKKHLLVFLSFVVAVTLSAQNNANPRSLSLSPRKLAWFQHRGVDLSKYDFRNQEYNRLIHQTKGYAMGANISATLGAGFTISGLLFLLSKRKTSSCAPNSFVSPNVCNQISDSLERFNLLGGAIQIGIAVPFFAISSANNRKYEKRVALLRDIFPVTMNH